MKTRLGDVQNLIVSAVREMNLARKRDYNGIWQDVHNDAGIIISCEALCCFLLSHRLLQEAGITIIGNDLVIAERDVFDTLAGILKQCDEKGFIGYPYVEIKKACPAFSAEPDYVDTASFVVTTLLSFWQLYRDKLLSEQHKELRESIKRNFIKALKVVDEAYVDGKGKGWSWSTVDKPDEPFLYYTWTTVETISDLEENKYILGDFPEAEQIADRLFEKLDIVRDFFEDKHLSDYESAKQRVQYDLRKGRLVFPKDDTEPHYNIWILLTLLQTRCSREDDLKASIDSLKQIYEDDRAGKFIGRLADVTLDGKAVLMPEHGVKMQDRCYLPQLVKVVALFVDTFPNHAEEYEEFMDDLYSRLLTNTRRDKYLFVWDAVGEYAIYYTERAIEALCQLYRTISKMTPSEAIPTKAQAQEISLAEPTAEGILTSLASAIDRQLGMEQMRKDVRTLEDQVGILPTLISQIDQARDKITEFEKAVNLDLPTRISGLEGKVGELQEMSNHLKDDMRARALDEERRKLKKS